MPVLDSPNVLYSAAQRAVASGKRRHWVSTEAPGHKRRRRKGTSGLEFLLQHNELGTLTGMLHSSCGSVPIALDRVTNVFYGSGLLSYFSARRSPRLTGQLANDPRVLA